MKQMDLEEEKMGMKRWDGKGMKETGWEKLKKEEIGKRKMGREKMRS